MTRKEIYKKYHKAFCEKMQMITEIKNADYTGPADNPFANFETIGTYNKDWILPGFLMRMSDKLSRIATFIQTGVLKVEDEKIEDTLVDLANYSALLAGYIRFHKMEGKKSVFEKLADDPDAGPGKGDVIKISRVLDFPDEFECRHPGAIDHESFPMAWRCKRCNRLLTEAQYQEVMRQRKVAEKIGKRDPCLHPGAEYDTNKHLWHCKICNALLNYHQLKAAVEVSRRREKPDSPHDVVLDAKCPHGQLEVCQDQVGRCQCGICGKLLSSDELRVVFERLLRPDAKPSKS